MQTIGSGADISVLFQRHGAAVFRRARRLLGSASEAEDATQEVFIRAARSIEKVDPGSQVTPWLYKITTNYCLNVMRDRSRRAELTREHLPDGTEQTSESQSEALVAVRRLLARADERQAQAAIYVLVDGLSHDEAAALLGVSKRTVGNLVERFKTWARAETGDTADGNVEAGDEEVRT